jgi:hypothetical protein
MNNGAGRSNGGNTRNGRNSVNNRNSVLPTRAPPAGPRLPLSGSEETFTNATYGSRKGKGNNNCYSWAIDDYTNTGAHKLQPGNLSRANGELDLGSCDAVVSRAVADLTARKKGYFQRDPAAPCKNGYYKIMAFLAKDNDFHWYKQHRDALVTWPRGVRTVGELAARLGVDASQVYTPTHAPKPGDRVLIKNAGLWSHKQGFATGPLLKDACGQAISDPRAACRTYSKELDYKDFCGAMCVRRS